ncbi:MAG: serine/threonine protein kinase [Deltaproteobacteria bacterium]|nr:serine/threonine protein kinase [Deltaproteobacteria bacterium]
MDHLDDNDASEFVSGSLPPAALTKVERHLARCRDCRTLVAALAADSADDSNVATVPHEKLSPSQVTQRPTRTLTVGDRVGRYLVLTTLGTGGMGVVFAAYDPQLDRKIALKLLRAGIMYNTKDARARLRREAQAIAQLSHPNVVNVYDVGATEDDDLYIAMEFVEGDTLTTWLKKYPRSSREIVDVFLQAARGLIAAHSVGLLHRDFKPDNVLVGGDGRVRVMDFGLARSVIVPDEAALPRPELAALNVELTATGTVLGTPRYMAPEQLTTPNIDARADQFSFCVALYEALYGMHPLPGATSVSMLEHGEKALAPPDGTKHSATVTRAVQRGLERDPARRFPTMGALIGELVPPPPRASARYAMLGLFGLVVLGGATVAVLRRGSPADELAPLDNKGVQPLIDQLNKSESERRLLLAQFNQQQLDHQELVVLRDKLIIKDQEIQKLREKVTELTQKPAKLANAARPSQAMLVTAAVSQVEGDLEGCFHEWSERVKGDADMLVKLTVTPEGFGHSSTATGPDSEFLRLCVAEAIERVQYPVGPEVLDLEVTIQWSAGLLNLAARVVGRRQTPSSLLDL